MNFITDLITHFTPAHASLETIPEDAKVFCCHKGQVLLTSEQQIPLAQDFPVALPKAYHFASLGGQLCVLIEDDQVWSDAAWHPAKWSREVLSQQDFQLVAYANHLNHWRQTHQYCGVCAQQMVDHDHERMRQCLHCGNQVYPRISPCVIMLVCRGDQMLLARSPHFPEGMHSTLAGFVEPGESLEHAVHREVFEEVGITVTNLRYICSQPWPFPDSLMMGFLVDYQSGEINIDPEEIESAGWFTKDDLPVLPSTTSISRYLIELGLSAKTAAKP